MAEETKTIDWTGQSGEKYTYGIYLIETPFKEAPGNYIFAKETSPKRWTAVYIGQTENLSERLTNHEKAPCAKRNGATHIHAHISENSEPPRKAEEKDLIIRWKPPCNEQLI